MTPCNTHLFKFPLTYYKVQIFCPSKISLCFINYIKNSCPIQPTKGSEEECCSNSLAQPLEWCQMSSIKPKTIICKKQWHSPYLDILSCWDIDLVYSGFKLKIKLLHVYIFDLIYRLKVWKKAMLKKRRERKRNIWCISYIRNVGWLSE